MRACAFIHVAARVPHRYFASSTGSLAPFRVSDHFLAKYNAVRL
jgi:hypothetical protein